MLRRVLFPVRIARVLARPRLYTSKAPSTTTTSSTITSPSTSPSTTTSQSTQTTTSPSTTSSPSTQTPSSTTTSPPSPHIATPPADAHLSAAELSIHRILRPLEPSYLVVRDVSGGCGSMFAIHIASPKFRGLSLLKQQRLVNATLGPELLKQWHGIQLRTEVSPESGAA